MSNIFTRNLLKDLLNEETSENNYSLPQFINIIDKKYDNNFTSSYMPQVGGNDLKHGTSNSTEDDVNQLISMLTSESDDSMKFSANSTQTEVLENRLKNMTFNGGGVKKIKQKGGADPQKIKEACKLLEDAGYTFSIKNQNCEQYLEKNSPSGIMKDFNLNNIFTKPTASPKNSKESNPSTSSFKPGTIYDTETSTVKKDINSSATSSINQSKQIKDLSDTSDVKPTTNNSLSLPPVSQNKIETETKSANSTSSFLPPVSASKITTTSQSDTKSVNSTSSFLPVGSVSKMSSTSLNSATSIPNASETENRTLLDSAVDIVKGVTKSISRAFVGDSDTSQSNVSVTSSQNKIVNSVLPSPTSSEKPTQTGGAKKGKKKMSKKASKKTSNKKKNSTKKGKKMSGGSKKMSKSTKKISKSTKKMSKGSKKKVSKKASSKKGKKMSGGAKKRGTKKTSTKKSKKSSKKSKKINKTRNTK